VEPVPAPKKVWIQDGHITRYPSVFADGSVHEGRICTDCHAGTDSVNTRATAHVSGFTGIPVDTACAGCHNSIIGSASVGLHTTLAGYPAILATRGYTATNATALARFEQQCTSCHAAVGTASPATACGQCHVSVPKSAGGGLVNAHAFQRTPSMEKNCTACHGSRVKDEFYGLNNALLTTNKAFLAADSPWKDAAFTLTADVHKTAGMECTDCHSGNEMHGQGAPTNDDRYAVTSSPSCDAVACHGDVTSSNSMHTSGHIAAMDCYVCHAQPYKNCFECHTDVTAENVAFFSISDNEPGAAHNHLMTFRAGKNPKYTVSGPHKQYSVLRHVPVDGDVFAYTGANAVTGLLPTPHAGPTWKYATPHNIVKNTKITEVCTNCHGSNYTKFWLTNAVTNAEGWVGSANQAGETTANSSLLISAPFSYTFQLKNE
jgi:thiosulfate/3-mercaptopyruvate sulfurtransferase